MAGPGSNGGNLLIKFQEHTYENGIFCSANRSRPRFSAFLSCHSAACRRKYGLPAKHVIGKSRLLRLYFAEYCFLMEKGFPYVARYLCLSSYYYL
ncbi:hypothetical protein CEXT_669491 [Caerostris extrusa]|uniref:Uncharacterized protein n=1 Tax=Caerostris extrusa TaxID=172846 RepID=A0AAV4VSG9_CAEEX|nr:hypothetical protein CEXT_669491 [Caerostris extrusa]